MPGCAKKNFQKGLKTGSNWQMPPRCPPKAWNIFFESCTIRVGNHVAQLHGMTNASQCNASSERDRYHWWKQFFDYHVKEQDYHVSLTVSRMLWGIFFRQQYRHNKAVNVQLTGSSCVVKHTIHQDLCISHVQQIPCITFCQLKMSCHLRFSLHRELAFVVSRFTGVFLCHWNNCMRPQMLAMQFQKIEQPNCQQYQWKCIHAHIHT